MYREHSYLEKGVSDFCLGLSFYFMTKNGNFCDFLLFFSNFNLLHTIKKTKAYIKNLRHPSLHIHLRNIHTNFQADKCYICEMSMLNKLCEK